MIESLEAAILNSARDPSSLSQLIWWACADIYMRQYQRRCLPWMLDLAIASNPTIERVAARLHQIFDGLVIIPESQRSDPEKAERVFRSRAYMALSLLDQTEANPVDAAAAITDGGDDGGIDCIYISEKHKRLVLGQSKFLSNVGKGVDLAEFNRFRDGVRNVINQNWTSTNAGLH